MICYTCLLYTSDAADERSSVDLGGRRIIKKTNKKNKTKKQKKKEQFLEQACKTDQLAGKEACTWHQMTQTTTTTNKRTKQTY